MKKIVKITGVIFAILALFILIVEKPGSLSGQKLTQSQPLLFPRFNMEEVTHLTVVFPAGAEMRFRKTANGWNADGQAISYENIEPILVFIRDLKKVSVISRNRGKHHLFGVDEKQAIHIQTWRNSRELTDFYIGQPAALNTQYVRLDGADEVFLATPPMPNAKAAP